MKQIAGFYVLVYSSPDRIFIHADKYERDVEFTIFRNYTDTPFDVPRGEVRTTSIFGIIPDYEEVDDGDVVDKYFFYDKHYGVNMSESFTTDKARIDAVKNVIKEEGLDSGDDLFFLDIVNGLPEIVVRGDVVDYEDLEGDENEQKA